MSYQVFISYRQNDPSAPTLAAWLYKELISEVGPGAVFRDRSELEEGDEYPKRFQDAVEEATVFIALIGRQWNPIVPRGGFKLDNPRDFVRREVHLALERKESNPRRLILPVRFDGASFPAKEELPACLHPLTKFQGSSLDDPYDEGIFEIVQAVGRKLDELDSIPAEEKWILQQIEYTLPSDRRRIQQIGKELKERFGAIPSAPASARSLARTLYLIGPEAVKFLSPAGTNEADVSWLLKLLATHWINPETARDLQTAFAGSSEGKMAAIECEHSDFTPNECLLKASRDIDGWPAVDGWPTVPVNPKDEIEEIIQQVHEELADHFQLNMTSKSSRASASTPLSIEAQREMLRKLLVEFHPLPMVLHLEKLAALDQNLIRKLREIFPPLHILVATDDMDEIKVIGSPIEITRPGDADEDEEKAYRAYHQACQRVRARIRNVL